MTFRLSLLSYQPFSRTDLVLQTGIGITDWLVVATQEGLDRTLFHLQFCNLFTKILYTIRKGPSHKRRQYALIDIRLNCMLSARTAILLMRGSCAKLPLALLYYNNLLTFYYLVSYFLIFNCSNW